MIGFLITFLTHNVKKFPKLSTFKKFFFLLCKQGHNIYIIEQRKGISVYHFSLLSYPVVLVLLLSLLRKGFFCFVCFLFGCFSLSLCA